jgi:hypothetical protein
MDVAVRLAHGVAVSTARPHGVGSNWPCDRSECKPVSSTGYAGESRIYSTVMQQLLVPLLVALSAGPILGQADFSSQQSITGAADRPTSIATADLDGDGILDVLASSTLDDEIAWYRNLGNGSFGPQQIVTTAADNPYSVQAADLDGDGRKDVLSVSMMDHKVAWYRNLGNGSFGAQVVISAGLLTPGCVRAADLDGDGDLDVLASFNNAVGQIAWYENLGPTPTAVPFGPPRILATGVRGVVEVDAVDLDGDGDMDVLAASGIVNRVAWYPNLGNQTFGSVQVIATASPAYCAAQAADLDGDGALDVLTTSPTGAQLAWHRNLGAGTFGPQQMISTLVAGCRDVAAADFDRDGDLDVCAIGSGSFNQVGWFENLGGGAFGGYRGIEPGNSTAVIGGVAILADDVDGDAMPDVLIAAASNDVVAWYANRLAAATPYGVGCTGVPVAHAATARPVLGGNAQADVRNVPGSLCILAAGVDRSNHPALGSLPFDLTAIGMPGCSLLQSADVPGVLLTPASGAGAFAWSMPLPAAPTFLGATFFTQAFGLAPQANALGIVASNAIAWRLGN